MGTVEDEQSIQLSRTDSIHKKLRPSQQSYISNGTILGLKDVFYENEPDLSYYCSHCMLFVSLQNLKDHKKYHQALLTLNYELNRPPKSTKHLLERRNSVITDLKVNSETVDIRQIQKIDDAYELLKQDLEDTFESCRKVDDKVDSQVDGFDVACSLEFVSAIGHCTNENSRWKSAMEDTKVYQDCFGNSKGKAFLGVYDGYSGKYAAAVAANELHYLLLNEMAKFDTSLSCCCTFNMFEENDISQYDLIRPPSLVEGNRRLIHRDSTNVIHQVIYTCEERREYSRPHLSSHHPLKTHNDAIAQTQDGDYSERMRQAFCSAYHLTDSVLSHGGDESSRVRWSGCSALTVLLETCSENIQTPPSTGTDISETEKSYDPPVTAGRLHIANAGNCHAVIVRDNKAYRITKDHTYANSKETKRIARCGGVFSHSDKETRLNGIVPTTRGLGNHGDPGLKKLMITEPSFCTVPVDQYAQFLILATPGVWKVFSPQEAAELLLQYLHFKRKLLPQNRARTPGYMSPSIELLLQSDPTPEAAVVQEDESEFADGPLPLLPTDRASERADNNVTFDVQSTPSQTVSRRSLHLPLKETRHSADSGNEADVDTDWASTVVNELGDRPVSSRACIARLMSRQLAERLVQCALLAGSKENISVVVVLLPGARIPD